MPENRRMPTDEHSKVRPYRLSVNILFKERMGREGRGKEFNNLVRQKYAEKGKGSWNISFKEAMREMGYGGPDEERRLYADWLAQHPEGAFLAFEAAMSRLPKTADPVEENDWVTTHPKVTRLSRGAEQVNFTPQDLFDTPNGICPSMRAANRLVLYATHQKDLNNSMSAGVKKAETTDKAKDADVVQDPGVEEIDRMLKEMEGG